MGCRKCAEIYSPQALEQLLDQLTTQEKTGQPFLLISFWIQKIPCSSSAAIIPANFYSPHGHPLTVGCRGPWEEVEGAQVFIFDTRGSYSQIEKHYTVPIADAREGHASFFCYWPAA